MQAADRETLGGISLANHPGLAEKTYDVIKTEILSGGLVPGTRLSVAELASQLGISRSPIKDALNRLYAEGYVSGAPRRGYFVRSLDAEEVAELMDASIVVQLGAALVGVHSADPADVDRMRDLVSKMETLLSTPGRRIDQSSLIQLDRQLHLLIVASAKNRWLTDMYSVLNAHAFAHRSEASKTPGRRPATALLEEHKAIVSAFESRDVRDLIRALVKHLRICGSRVAARVSELEE